MFRKCTHATTRCDHAWSSRACTHMCTRTPTRTTHTRTRSTQAHTCTHAITLFNWRPIHACAPDSHLEAGCLHQLRPLEALPDAHIFRGCKGKRALQLQHLLFDRGHKYQTHWVQCRVHVVSMHTTLPEDPALPCSHFTERVCIRIHAGAVDMRTNARARTQFYRFPASACVLAHCVCARCACTCADIHHTCLSIAR